MDGRRSGLKRIVSGVLAGFLFLASVLPFAGNVFQVSGNPVVSPDDWSMYRHDALRSGYSTSSAPDTNQVLWTYNTSFEVDSSPAIADGRVVVGVSNGDVVALDLKTGTEMWKYSIESGQNSLWSSPALDAGRVYIGSRDYNLYCLNGSSGALIWSFPTGNEVDSSPVVAGGRVYFCSSDGYLYSLNTTSGALVWKNLIGVPSSSFSSAFSSPAIMMNVVFVGSATSNVYAVNASTGDTLWTFAAGGGVTSALAVYPGKLFGLAGSRVFRLDANTGSLVWNVTLDFPNYRSSPALTLDRLFVAVGSPQTGRILCLNVSTGAELWRYEVRGDIWSSPGVADGKVFVGSSAGNGRVYCLNETTGTLVWEHPTNERVVSGPVISNGIVFVGCGGAFSGGAVYAFGTLPEEKPEGFDYVRWVVIPVIVIVIVAVAVLGVWKLRKKYTLTITERVSSENKANHV